MKTIKVVGEPLREWEPGRWWRLMSAPDPDCENCLGGGEYAIKAYGEEIGTYGCDCLKLKAESSSESEVRGFMEPGDTLYRIYEYHDKQFREVIDK